MMKRVEERKKGRARKKECLRERKGIEKKGEKAKRASSST